MVVTPESWKESARQKLQELSKWLQRRRQEDVPYLVYGTVAGLTVWPLVESAVTTGQLAPVIGAIYGTAAGVGANLLANQIEAWKNRVTPPTEDEVATWLAEQAAANADLRQTVDSILEKLDAISLAQNGLPAPERDWFVQTLQAELARLGSQVTFTATLQGGGAIAQGAGAIAVGERGVLVEHGSGSIITGDGNRLVQTEQYIENYHATDPTATEDAAILRQTYLARLLQEAGQLSLAGIDPKAASDESGARLNLTAVYTALLTIQVERQDGLPAFGGRELGLSRSQPVPALAQLNRHPHLVLLGDPGGGKSTFVNFVTLCMAGACLGREEVNLHTLTTPLPDDEGAATEERQPWEHGALLPVRVILRDLAARGLPEDPTEIVTADHLWQFLEKELKTAACVPHLKRELAQRGGLILLDGLDEVPEAHQRRAQIKQLVEDLAATLPRARLFVTSRTYAYQKQDWRLTGFAEAVLSPFTPGQIRQFVDRWYGHMAQQRGLDAADAQGRAELLKRSIFNSNNLRGLAERPLLLTLMASLHAWRGGSLPEKREELYADTVDLLLDWWEERRVVCDTAGQVLVMQPSLAELLKVGRDKVRQLLNELAYQAHAAQPDPSTGTADIPEADLMRGLLQLSDNPDVRPARLVEFLRDRAGLLLPHGVGVYTFPHRTFQEYLAACYLTDHDYPDAVAALVRADPNRWREVTLLAGAKAARGSASTIWSLADALCHRDVGEGLAAAISPDDVWGAHLAAQALAETADLQQVSPRNQAKVGRLQKWLVHILRSGQLPATERAAAAVNLAHLGDPRPEVMTVDGMQFCMVPRGSFWMGSDEDNPVEKDAERPLHELDIPYDYWLGRCPVTNAQFQAFVDAGGYQAERYWPEAIAANCWREGQVEGHTWITEKQESERRWRDGPYDYGRPFNLPNHPVVDLIWYEALAYCHWLMERWQTAGWLPNGWVVQLPSEAEWEKAARGGLRILAEPQLSSIMDRQDSDAQPLLPNPAPQRRFPWGDEAADPERANYEKTGIGSTNGVGCFPIASSTYGCEEMAGNVLEWTRSLWGRYDVEKSQAEGSNVFNPYYRYPYLPDDGREKLAADDWWFRVERGGIWDVDETWLRCASRNGGDPGYWISYFGFRVVVCPFLSLAS